MPGHITLITEDLPSEAVAHRLLGFIDPDTTFDSLGRRGVGYIQAKLRNLNHAAAGMRIVAIADRDSVQKCPVETIKSWLGGVARNPNLIVRMAEMEIESWIMADREGIASFLNVPLNRIPQFPDTLVDPKQELVNIARLSRNRATRDQLCPASGAQSVVGPAYNSAIESFIRSGWRPARALQNSPSLRRAELRIRELAIRAP
jgi:hypothetical protein